MQIELYQNLLGNLSSGSGSGKNYLLYKNPIESFMWNEDTYVHACCVFVFFMKYNTPAHTLFFSSEVVSLCSELIKSFVVATFLVSESLSCLSLLTYWNIHFFFLGHLSGCRDFNTNVLIRSLMLCTYILKQGLTVSQTYRVNIRFCWHC